MRSLSHHAEGDPLAPATIFFVAVPPVRNMFVAIRHDPLSSIIGWALCSLRFDQCCQDAWNASVSFVSKITGIPSKQIEAKYKEACHTMRHSLFGADDAPAEDEMDLHINPVEETDENSDPCFDFLSSLKADAEMMQQEADEGDIFKKVVEEPLDKESDKVADTDLDFQFDQMPDAAQLRQIFQGDEEHDHDAGSKQADADKAENKDGNSGNHLPQTLKEALKCRGDLFNALWRYCLKLRCAAGGIDRMFIPNPKNLRRQSRKLNWYQRQACNYMRVLCLHRLPILQQI